MFVLPPPFSFPLSDAETRKPYSKYYYEGAKSPTPETMAQIVWGAPMDPPTPCCPTRWTHFWSRVTCPGRERLLRTAQRGGVCRSTDQNARRDPSGK